jgi:hypothetical protein
MFVLLSYCFLIPIPFWGKVFASSRFTDRVWFSAKGAVSLPAWGNAPGLVKPTKPTGAESAIPFLGNFECMIVPCPITRRHGINSTSGCLED